MNRAELERLDREALIARADKAGVQKASILTRPELVDELLVRAAPRPDDPALRRVRGLFGRARDLLARVIERGLHLPDAADRLRAVSMAPAPEPRTVPSALPTVTLAEIYAAQGHRRRALETLERVIEREPEHSAARTLLAQLQDETYVAPAPPKLSPEEDEAQAAPLPDRGPAEPTGFLDDEPLPTKYDVDECVAIPVDPTTLFVYWEVRDGTLDHLRRTRPHGNIALRVLVIVPTWDGPRSSMRDFDVSASVGDWFVRDLPAGSVVRAAIGWRSGDVFLPIAHSPALETPAGGPWPVLADVLVKWTPRGAIPLSREDLEGRILQRALFRIGGQGRGDAGAEAALGSSEIRARAGGSSGLSAPAA